jgi:hypothetical protein
MRERKHLENAFFFNNIHFLHFFGSGEACLNGTATDAEGDSLVAHGRPGHTPQLESTCPECGWWPRYSLGNTANLGYIIEDAANIGKYRKLMPILEVLLSTIWGIFKLFSRLLFNIITSNRPPKAGAPEV